MTFAMEATVHCPACGDAIVVPVLVQAVALSRMGRRVEVFFQDRAVEHACGVPDPLAQPAPRT